MKIVLYCDDPWAPARRIVVDRFPAVIGRGSAADVRLQDRWASRRHCAIEWVDDVLVVRDLGSTHGTFVNGRQTDQSPLLPGDRLTLGLTRLRVEYRQVARARIPAALPGRGHA